MARLKAFHALAWCIPVCATILVYWQVHTHGFIDFDDGSYTRENPVVTQGLSWPGIVWAFSGLHVANYHPLTWISHMLDYELFGDRPGAFALVNLGIHVINCLLVGVLFKTLFQSIKAGIVSALIFAVHPVLVEAVAWISQRKSLLSTGFALATVVLYLKAASPSRCPRPWLYLAGSFACYVLSLLAKSMYVTLPGVLMLIELFGTPALRVTNPRGMLGMRIGKALHRLSAFLMVAAAVAIATIRAQSEGRALVSIETLTLGDRLATALVGYSDYVRRFIYPSDLSVIYPRPDVWPVDRLLCSGAVVAGVTLVLFCARSKLGNAPWLGWITFLGMLLPVSGIVQVGDQASADRYMYGPILGLLFMLTALARRLQPSLSSASVRSTACAAAAIWIMGAGVVAFRQTSNWADSFRLAESSMQAVGPHPTLLSLKASALIRARRFAEAQPLCLEALRLAPTHGVAMQYLAASQYALGQHTEAFRTSAILVAVEPWNADAWTNHALYALRANRTSEAHHALNEAETRANFSIPGRRLWLELRREELTRRSESP